MRRHPDLMLASFLLACATTGAGCTAEAPEPVAKAPATQSSAVAPGAGATKEAATPAAAKSASWSKLPAWSAALYDAAIGAAERMPLDPHIKNRSKVQEELASGLLAAGEVDRAHALALSIANWRKGCVLADCAYECTVQGRDADAEAHLALAIKVLGQQSDEEVQIWQKGRIRAKIARTMLRQGRLEAAAPYLVDLEPSEAKLVADERARTAPFEDFEQQVGSLAPALSGTNFDAIKAAMETATLVYERWYERREEREKVEALLRANWDKLPRDLRLAAILRMSESALKRGDKGVSLKLLDETRLLVDALRWLPEHRLPTEARIAELLHKAGEVDRAAQVVAAALQYYEAERPKIVNIERAGALRPMAESLARMDRRSEALALYKRVVEEGMENPNARPRLDDLAATVVSMVGVGLEPDAALAARIAEIGAKLDHPW
jgi:hypothetical protein